jgi:hypothetical protein
MPSATSAMAPRCIPALSRRTCGCGGHGLGDDRQGPKIRVGTAKSCQPSTRRILCASTNGAATVASAAITKQVDVRLAVPRGRRLGHRAARVRGSAVEPEEGVAHRVEAR